MEIPLKTRNKTTIWPSNPTPRHIPWGNQNWKGHMHPLFIEALFTIARAWKQPRWMDKEVVVHTHNGILLSHRKEPIWVSSNEVDEPRTYYTERSESERERYISHSNAHMWNLEKWDWIIYLQGSNGETHREQTYGHTERRGEGETYEKNNMETYITICKIDIQWKFTVWLSKLKQGLWINLNGWDGEGDGREVQKGEDICIPVAD